MADLASYKAIKRAPLCHDYKANGRDFHVCGFPPPSSGAIAVGQILGILGNTHAASLPLQDGLPSADWLHLYTDAARLAFADRGQYVADPAYVRSPEQLDEPARSRPIWPSAPNRSTRLPAGKA